MPGFSPAPFATTTLDNGLTVVAVAQPALHRAHVALHVRIGSRFETEGTNGLSHFLEHMLYRGTPSLPDGVVLLVNPQGHIQMEPMGSDQGRFLK